MHTVEAVINATDYTPMRSKVSTLQNLLPHSYILEVDYDSRMFCVISKDPPHLVSSQQLTRNEWSILMSLLSFHPHYAPHNALLSSITLLSLSDSGKRLQEAQRMGPDAFKRELKPVHRALSSLRPKLSKLSPMLKISLIRGLGYSLTTAPA